MMKPTSPSPPPAALTATGEHVGDQSVFSQDRQLAANIMTSFVHSLDNIPEPIDEYSKAGVLPTEEEIVNFEKQVMGNQVRDQEELGAGKEKTEPKNSSLMAEHET